jgi:hypothetical protein
MPGKDIWSFAGLEVKANLAGNRGVYLTDEFLDVTVELYNTSIDKRLRGELVFFYGFGTSGLEGRTHEIVSFDLEPKCKEEKKILKRLIGIQGNGIIAVSLHNEHGAWVSETQHEILFRPGLINSPNFYTLYTFTSIDREFQELFYTRPERIMKQTNRLTTILIVLTSLAVLFALFEIVKFVLQYFGILTTS